MPRTSKRKTQRASYTADAIHAAVVRIQQHGEKIRKVAMETGIDKSTLSRYVRKFTDGIPTKVGYWSNRRVFSHVEEMELVNYLITLCKMYYGLTPMEVRRLAYELAYINGNPMSYNWMDNSLAGEDWCTLVSVTTSASETSSSLASTSLASTSSSRINTRQHFSPHELRPYPPAPPRKLGGKHNRQGKTRVLTDTPLKAEIVLRHEMKKKRKPKHRLFAKGKRMKLDKHTPSAVPKAAPKSKSVRKSLFCNNTATSDDVPCLYCRSLWSQSSSSEVWIRCQGQCQETCHVQVSQRGTRTSSANAANNKSWNDCDSSVG